MKQILPILGIIVFFHYFFLTQITVAATDGFTGVVESVKEHNIGLFERAEVSFAVPEIVQGNSVKTKRVIKMVHEGPIQFKVGKTYSVKAHHNWLCTYSKKS